MLVDLNISNFAIIDDLSIELKEGLTVITGETGAGKSITIDALSILLGEKADPKKVVKHGKDKCEIIGGFDVLGNTKLAEALECLGIEPSEYLVIKRVVKSKGAGKAYINDKPVNISTVKSIAKYIIDIHSQNGHQLLLDKKYQLKIMDKISGSEDLLRSVSGLYHDRSSLVQRREEMVESIQQNKDRVSLIEFQINELEEFAPDPEEFSKIEKDLDILENAADLKNKALQIESMAYGDDGSGLLSMINKMISLTEDMSQSDSECVSFVERLNSSKIELDDCLSEISSRSSNYDVDLDQVDDIRDRVSEYYSLSKKYFCSPDELGGKLESLKEELGEISFSDEDIEELDKQINEISEAYVKKAEELEGKRKSSAKKFSKTVSDYLSELNLVQGSFSVAVERKNGFFRDGFNDIEFLIKPNIDQPAKPLKEIASGGELSRVGLSIQAIASDIESAPTIIFDEIDVGIGGATVKAVAKILKKISGKSQVLCVTHQAQVAAKSDNHFVVSKENHANKTTTCINELDKEQKISEVARMLTGESDSELSLNHAKKLIAE